MKSKEKLEGGNERVAMMTVARDIVGMLFHRDHPSPEGYQPQEKRQLTTEEQNLYSASMKFLTKELNIGARYAPSTPDEDLPPDPTGKSPVKEPVAP